MLQRIQTYYLGIIIVIQVIAVSGMDFIRFFSDKYVYKLNAWGVSVESVERNHEYLPSSWSPDDSLPEGSMVPVFIGFILIALLAFWCIMSYKNLDRQLKLGRAIFYLYLVSAFGIYLLAIMGDSFIGQKIVSNEVGMSYWIFICGLPLSFLANTGIRRDKRLLDSLKRL